MDLCLPPSWRKHPQALLRDDVGTAPPASLPLGGCRVCGLRNWREASGAGKSQAPRPAFQARPAGDGGDVVR